MTELARDKGTAIRASSSPARVEHNPSSTQGLDDMAADAPQDRMDSGLLAWLQVLGSWILFANTW